MYRPKQFNLFRYPSSSTSFGGSHSIGVRKEARPVSVKEALHVVLRAEQARGKYSLLIPAHARMLYRLMVFYGKKFEVKIYNFAIVGNHAHFILKAKTKRGFQNFLRVFAGQVAQRVTKAKPGHPLAKRFWDYLAFSRIIPWGKAFENAKKYVFKNIL